MIERKIKTDALVVGSGLSGIKVSKDLAEQGHEVLLISKTKLASGSSFYPLKASLGTQVTSSEQDKDVFLQDVKEMSRGMHREDLAEVYVNEIPERIHDYEDIGIHAKKLEDERKACFAKHPRHIYLISGWEDMRKNVRDILEAYSNLKLMEKTICFSLIKRKNQIVGALIIDEQNDWVLVECQAVILASGGFGNIFKHNLNPTDVDGSGHVLALEAGAKLVNMEFIQFIPGITSPRYKTLFGEQTLMYGQDLVDQDGKSLLDNYMSPELSKREMLNIRSGHGPFTHTLNSKYFDIAMMKYIIKNKNENGFTMLFADSLYDNKEEFYTVYLEWLKTKNVDFRTDEIKIAPFAHASNGGVHIDRYGKTGVAGLYAVGELSSNIEGANRLGGNSTGGCLVFGYRVALDCHEYLKTTDSIQVSCTEANQHLQDFLGDNGNDCLNPQSVSAKQVIKSIREIMWYDGNVVRSEERLLAALSKVKKLKQTFSLSALTTDKHTRRAAIKANNFLILSQILLKTMLLRRESRGAHFREDYPEENLDFSQRLFVSKGKDHTMNYEFV